jgi:hypothetical protein
VGDEGQEIKTLSNQTLEKASVGIFFDHVLYLYNFNSLYFFLHVF